MSSSPRPELRLDWCSRKAARWAAERWHYSRGFPIGHTVNVGVWEGGAFMGAIVFGRGVAPHIGSPYGLDRTEVAELVRVALRGHAWPVSRMLAIAVRMCRRLCPGLRLLVSYADTSQGHYGGIYQAAGWTYVGTRRTRAYLILGEVLHNWTVKDRYGRHALSWLREHVDPQARYAGPGVKHKYLLPLDRAMRAMVAGLAQPYPKRPPSTGASAPTEERRWKPDPAAPTSSAKG